MKTPDLPPLSKRFLVGPKLFLIIMVWSVVGMSVTVTGQTLELSDLDGTNGFALTGINPGDRSGASVSGVGDINGDGIADLIIGAPGAAPGNQAGGQCYVVFGSTLGFPPNLNLSDLDGSNGFTINGFDTGLAAHAGQSVSGAGDLNGDGVGDLIIGGAGPLGDTFRGESYVVFGSNTGFTPSLDLAALNGTDGFAIEGIDGFDQTGFSVSGAGDVNGDGMADVIIGAPTLFDANSDGGKSYVIFGSKEPFGARFHVTDLNGFNGFAVRMLDTTLFTTLGFSVSGGGDVNGDGIDDLVMGNPPDNAIMGSSYVVFGSTAGFNASLPVSELNGANGFAILGANDDDQLGKAVSIAGDFNGDGIKDIIIGASDADPDGRLSAGKSYVVFGKSEPFAASMVVSALDGTNGFVINGIHQGDQAGNSVSDAGDVNGDGIDDLVIGAFAADPGGNLTAGEGYVVFGTRSGFGASLELSDLDGTNGYRISGNDPTGQFGSSVSSAGDINGDGVSDMIFGAELATDSGEARVGKSYVVFGKGAVSSRISGPWFSIGQSGHGWMIELLEGVGPADPDRINAYWYTYLNGQPVWLLGTGDVRGSGATLDVTMTAGAGFPPGFAAADVERIPWGTLTFNFVDDTNGTATWDSLLHEFGSGSLDIVQLAAISGSAAGCRSGSYYNASQSGHGFVAEVVNIDGADQVVLAWYVYLDGEQVWLFGQALLQGDTAVVPMNIFSGADFPPNFDPADVQWPFWGTVTVTFTGPNSAEFEWESDFPGYASGALEAERLTTLTAHICPE